MTDNRPVLNIPPRAVRLAGEYHNGQGSILYAVSSSGGLFRGTVRPAVYHYCKASAGVIRWATPAEHDYWLVARWANGCRDAADTADTLGETGDAVIWGAEIVRAEEWLDAQKADCGAVWGVDDDGRPL